MKTLTNIITWKVPEFVQKKRPKNWHLYIGGGTLLATLVSFLTLNILFGIFILLAGFTMILFAYKKPEIISIEVNNDGIILGNKLYVYSEIDSFWIADNTTEPKIFLKSKHMFMPLITIPLNENMDLDELQTFLEEYVDEEEHEEPLPEKIMNKIGF